MKGLRKFWFGMVTGLTYLAAATFLINKAIETAAVLAAQPDFTALGILLTGLSTGVVGVSTAFIYGNIKSHEASNGNPA